MVESLAMCCCSALAQPTSKTIPCYWTIDWTNEDTYQNAQRQLYDMIARDHNRANVIIWSIANETPHSADRGERKKAWYVLHDWYAEK